MTPNASIAIPRGPSAPLTYSVPDEWVHACQIGSRVLVPMGRRNRRITGYVVARDVEVPADWKLKAISDLMDAEPLFNAHMLQLFEFLATYYRASLGDAIRTGLPAAFNITESRYAAITPLGEGSLDAEPLLTKLVDGPKSFRSLDCSTAVLLRLEKAGLVELQYELDRPSATAKTVNVVSLNGEPLEVTLKAGAGPQTLYELLQNDGPQVVPSLKERIKNHAGAVRRLTDLGVATISRRTVFRDPWRGAELERDTPPALTDAQRAAVTQLTAAVDSLAYQGFLLRGVTGSGKTEVYLHALAHVLAKGGGGIVLVPEIALTPQLAGRFRARFGDQVAVLHSGLTNGERLDQWKLIKRGLRPVVVGARSALFAPIPRLQLIVVDEEHESSFKQDESPRYHGRDLALKRGLIEECSVVLGSATPSLETVLNAERGRLKRIDLPERIANRPLPVTELVDLKVHAPVHKEALVSQPLLDALEETIRRKEQAIIFINRRGYANFLLCRTCGSSVDCPDCSVSLTYHRSTRRLICHYCGYTEGIPSACPSCTSETLSQVGTGTEQVEQVLAEAIPGARVARMDRDTTRGKSLVKLLDRFRAQQIDILVGTQMVAKGHDFPSVTLVGVLLAEQMLRMQDFRASERTFQLLTQVAGRAGRHELPGRVIVQAYDPEHYSLKRALEHDFDGFVVQERHNRQRRGFPPYGYLVWCRIDALDSEEAYRVADRVGQHARSLVQAEGLRVHVMGPVPAPIDRLKGRSRFVIQLRSDQRGPLHRILRTLDPRDHQLVGQARLAIDVDPINLM